MVRMPKRERMWGAMASGAGAVATVAAVLMLGLSSAVPSWLEEGFEYSAHGKAAFFELQNKDMDWDVVPDDGTWGWFSHGLSMKVFNGSIVVFGMTADSWFLVSMGSYDEGTAELLGSAGFFGTTENIVLNDDGTVKYGWADLAIFKTDAYGYGRAWIPDLDWYEDVYGPTEFPPMPPELPAGTYEGVDVSVKYIGTGETLDMGLLVSGGYQDDLKFEYNLYETSPLSFTLGCAEL